MNAAPREIVDRLSIEYLMWNAYVEGRLCPLAQPVRLPRRELEEVASLSERFSLLLERTIDLVLADPALLDRYGFSPEMRRMIASEPTPRPPVVLSRYDAFRTPRGWQFAEFNCDVPGGIHEGAGLNDLILGDPSKFRVVPLLTEALCTDRVSPVVAVCYASGYGEDLEQCQFLRRAWNRTGVQAILCNPGNLVFDGRALRVFGEKVDAVYRFFPGEWMAQVPNLEAILEAYREGLFRMINPFSSLIAQSKKTMAVWHENPGLFDPAERELILRHVPRTTSFQLAEMDRYRADRERLVVKRQFGRVGEEVLMGIACLDDEWAQWLKWPASEPEQWIVQDRFESLPVDGGGGPLHGCFGPYVVAGRFGGFYTRLSGDGFITYDALTAAVGEEDPHRADGAGVIP
jgi:hypothetical protein